MVEDRIAAAQNLTVSSNFNLDRVTIVSFNMHGMNQGKLAICDIIASHNPDIILMQEHWLTPANLYKLDDFDGYYAFGSSAMNNTIVQGPLYGRPFGGVGALIKNSLRCDCETLYAGDRFLVLKIYNFIIINVYMPCDGSTDRLRLYEFILNEILVWREQFSHCSYILAGE
jgi:exonuclease III